MSDRQPKAGGRRRRRRFRDRPKPERGQREAARDGQPGEGAKGGTPRGGTPSGDRTRGQRKRNRGDGDRRDHKQDRRGERGRSGRERELRLEYTSVINLPEEQSATCPVCGRKVRDAVSALSYGEDRAPAHFDCVMERLQAEKVLAPDERLCYLGGGNFGVVKSAQGEGKAPFSIRDRVQYETGQERPDWRRVLDAIASRRKPDAAPPQQEPQS